MQSQSLGGNLLSGPASVRKLFGRLVDSDLKFGYLTNQIAALLFIGAHTNQKAPSI
jgi:hypothetical protein